jgi:hypothetical protein
MAGSVALGHGVSNAEQFSVPSARSARTKLAAEC